MYKFLSFQTLISPDLFCIEENVTYALSRVENLCSEDIESGNWIHLFTDYLKPEQIKELKQVVTKADNNYRKLIFHLCCSHLLYDNSAYSFRYLDTFSQYDRYFIGIDKVFSIFRSGDLETVDLIGLLQALDGGTCDDYFDYIVREYRTELNQLDGDSDYTSDDESC